LSTTRVSKTEARILGRLFTCKTTVAGCYILKLDAIIVAVLMADGDCGHDGKITYGEDETKYQFSEII
jgi:hypothetical protein